MVAAPAQQKTARSIAEHGKARLAPGPTGDVVIIDAVLEGLIGVDNVPEDSPSASPLRPGARKTSSRAAPSCAAEWLI
ncbi:MAG: hypothetical protein E6I52_13140 [Chloroflexi bacterium]|nr:MAG: hypothetical protein E6I52_13140 [Chloroflexota bacterium]